MTRPPFTILRRREVRVERYEYPDQGRRALAWAIRIVAIALTAALIAWFAWELTHGGMAALVFVPRPKARPPPGARSARPARVAAA